MTRSDVSLDKITLFPFDTAKMDAFAVQLAAKEQDYKDKYGDQWQAKYLDDAARKYQTSRNKYINGLIYYIGKLTVSFVDDTTPEERAMFDQRLHAVYGEQYDELIENRTAWDPRVGELLIQEAIQTGTWEELPDQLQAEYHKRIGEMK